MDALILVASADPGLRRLCRYELTKLGLDVLIAHNAWDALHIAGQASPDAVIVDSDVPGQHSYNLLPDLSNAGVPTILVAGAHRRCLMELIPLADEFVGQPTVDALAAAIGTIVARCARLQWRRGGARGVAAVDAHESEDKTPTP